MDAGELGDHPSGHRRGQERFAHGNGPDRRDQLFGGIVLEDQPARAGPERLVDVLVEIEGREDEDACEFVGGQDPSGRLDPVEHGHTDVHQDDVRIHTGRFSDRIEPVLGLGHDLDVGFLGEQHAQSRPHHRLVVDQEYADRHDVWPFNGSLALRKKPPPLAAPTFMSPP